MSEGVAVAVLGIDHRHIFGMIEGMLAAGARCTGWWSEGTPETLAGFQKRFSDLPRFDSADEILSDPHVQMVLIAAPPNLRADLAIRAMRAGKDVMVDKPGCTTREQLEAIRSTVAETGRIWSIDFSERFEVPATLKALELVRDGAIGRVVQTIGLGPHRLNRATRANWFFDEEKYGGILTDIASHQIDQFLVFSRSEDAEIIASSVGNFANPHDPGLQDFGEVLLRSSTAQGYIRVDWYTPDALPNWGDGRLTILGTEGYIELRKYVDVAGRPGTDHLFLVNGTRCEHIDCSEVPLAYFRDLVFDIENRTETAMPFTHAARVTQLALEAQTKATRLGALIA